MNPSGSKDTSSADTSSADITIDPKEVDFYSRLAETWWDPTGPFKPLHKLNEFRVAYIVEQLCQHVGRDPTTDEPLKDLDVVDVGCGGGILSESMARLGANVTGIDVVEKNIRIAALHAAEQGLSIDYRLCPANALADEVRKFDVVLNMEVVEHVAELPAFMHDCCRLMRPGGSQIIATINRTPLSWLFAIVGAEYVLRLLPRGTHRWSMFRKPAEIVNLLNRQGADMQDAVGVALNPFSFRFRFTGSMAVNYMIHATRRTED